ncbi:hypothetical protein [Oenococcus oeni]|uniref:Uncharacterized protein n=1 Tax=Oenococcus oeni (strain ATCC BAA-331 / PSU-1) TaxID=203123 RepID=Q04EI3_OENOB|nr:hypothetical protein [Oenococcus oeni]ABJ57139.1 hypothetical protein OEOE_1266 [Oenococcus oeni PSU-1]
MRRRFLSRIFAVLVFFFAVEAAFLTVDLVAGAAFLAALVVFFVVRPVAAVFFSGIFSPYLTRQILTKF